MPPPTTDRELLRAIKQEAYAPVYYFHGEDDFLKDAMVGELVRSAVDPATRDFNYDVVRGAEATPDQLESLLHTPPMMAARRVVVVRDVSALRKDGRQILDRYLASPAADSVVILVTQAGAKPDRGLEQRATAVNFAPLSPDRVVKWVRHHAETSLGVAITDEAIKLLVPIIGSDLPQLAAELDKLANYTGGAAIDAAAVSAVVGVRHGETLGDLLDAVASRDARQAMLLLPYVMALPKVSAVPVIMALSAQMLAIAWARAAQQSRRLPAQAVERELFALLKEAGAYPGRPWGEAIRTWLRVLPLWDDASLDRALDTLLDADRAAKESRVSSEEQLVSSLILSLCGIAKREAA
jgi:DNA polymerase III subunit delta